MCFIMVRTAAAAWVVLQVPNSAGFLAGMLQDIPNKDSRPLCFSWEFELIGDFVLRIGPDQQI
jgi:hypothetical protein